MMQKVDSGVELLMLSISVITNYFQKRVPKQIMDEHETSLKFPCEFSIKIFGLNNSEFETTVLSIIRHTIKDLKENAISSRSSKDSKYLALTVTINVNTKNELDHIY